METTIKEGLTKVQRLNDGKCNLIGENGKFLSKQWFDWIDDFREGFARVQREDRQYNFIDTNGKIISEKWFDFISSFYEGFDVVRKEKYSQRKSKQQK